MHSMKIKTFRVQEFFFLSYLDPETPHAEVSKTVHDQFLKWKEKKSPKDYLELDVAHTFCQWQCCLQAGLYLNQLLCRPLPEPDLTR